MTIERHDMKERIDAGAYPKAIVDLDEIIEQWVKPRLPS